MKRITIGIISSFIGGTTAYVISQGLLIIISYNMCEYSSEGLFFGYTCPWWHPQNWQLLSVLFGIFIGPMIAVRIVKEKPYSYKVAFFIGLTSVLAFYLFLYLFLRSSTVLI